MSIGAPVYLPHLSTLLETDPSVDTAGAPMYLPSMGMLFSGSPAAGASDAGSLTFTGQTAQLKVGRKYFATTAQTFALTGIDATLTKSGLNASEFPGFLPHIANLLSGVDGVYAVLGEPGTFSLTGRNATLGKGLGISAATGTFTMSGAPANRDFEHDAAKGTFTFTGVAATLLKTRPGLIAAAGTFTLSGKDAGLFPVVGTAEHYTMQSVGTSFALTGVAAIVKRGLRLSADAGTFARTGRAAILSAPDHPIPTPMGGSAGQAKLILKRIRK